MNKKNLELVETGKIFILNPRTRNEMIAKEIRKNIEDVGLKRPITVRRREFPEDGYEYDLVCGQGRLEAYIAAKQSKIPAIVIEVTEEDALIMSLTENIARKNYTPAELFQGVKVLMGKNYSPEEISKKTGLGRDYIVKIETLIENCEDRLLNAVETNRIPLRVAIDISTAKDSEMQVLLQDAYEKKILSGNKLNYVRKLVELRRKSGKSITPRFRKKMSSTDLNKIYLQEMNRRKILFRKASMVDDELIILIQSLKTLYRDENFKTLLRAEKLDKETPVCVSERMK